MVVSAVETSILGTITLSTRQSGMLPRRNLQGLSLISQLLRWLIILRKRMLLLSTRPSIYPQPSCTLAISNQRFT